MEKSLLQQLYSLQQIDHCLRSKATQSAYLARAKLLAMLGLDFFASIDLMASGETSISFKSPSHTALQQQFQAENKTVYYREWQYLLQGNQLFKQGQVSADIYIAFGGSLALLGLYQMALRHYQQGFYCIHSATKRAALSKDYGLLLNLLGQNGWQFYAQRWQSGLPLFSSNLQPNLPTWKGEKRLDKKLYLYAEQGLGDNIQFVRYAIALKQAGVNVVVKNHQALEPYLAFNLAKYGIPTAEKETQCDYAVAMMDLPLYRDLFSHFPMLSDKYLCSRPSDIQRWQQRISVSSKLKIGFAFQGSRTNTKDHFRSIPIEQFSALFALDMEFHCLQKDVSESEQAYLKQFDNVVVWHNELVSFFETSALIEQMDLVICVDTAIAHLSGALGKPTWILINYNPDFRWGLESEKSDWYASVTLFRQSLDYAWERVLENLYCRLQRGEIK